jgi:hypothetical protein
MDIMDIASLGLWLSIGLLMCYLVYGLWIAYRNDKPWNSVRNVAIACLILLFIGYDLKMEIFVTLGLGVFMGLTAILLSNLYHRNLKLNDIILFLASVVVLMINSSQIYMIFTY